MFALHYKFMRPLLSFAYKRAASAWAALSSCSHSPTHIHGIGTHSLVIAGAYAYQIFIVRRRASANTLFHLALLLYNIILRVPSPILINRAATDSKSISLGKVLMALIKSSACLLETRNQLPDAQELITNDRAPADQLG